MSGPSKKLLDALPSVPVVVERLDAASREVVLLKKLLKAAKAAEIERTKFGSASGQQPEEVTHAAVA